MNPSDILDAVENIVIDAGLLIEEIKGRGIEVSRKADGSPVTNADHASDEMISQALQALTPEIPVVSEEGVEAGKIPDISGGRFWLTDPLDGTRQFIKNALHGRKDRDDYAVAVALIDNRRPVLGVFHYPAMGLVCGAAGPGTAFARQKPDAPKQMLKVRPPQRDALEILLASREEMEQKDLKKFLTDNAIAPKLIENLSGMQKYYLIAAGERDMMIRLQPVFEWDVAPGHALIEAAGGKMETLFGAPVTYGNYTQRVAPFIVHTGLQLGL